MNPEKVYLPSSHIKLGLMKNLKTMDQNKAEFMENHKAEDYHDMVADLVLYNPTKLWGVICL
jgi:hypothetical protein